MKIQLFLVSVLLIMSCIVLRTQQSITLSEQCNCYNSVCEADIVHQRNRLLFSSEIDISRQESEHLPNALYELKRPNDNYVPICYINLHKCDEYKTAFCSCNTTDTKKRFTVLISLQALPHLSEAFLRGRLSSDEFDMRSEERKLPKIYDSTKIEPLIYVNNVLVNHTDCNEIINGSDVNIMVVVLNNMNLLCALKINEDNRTLMQVESSVLIYTTTISGQQTFTIIYEVCKSEEYSRAFTCLIQSANKTVKNETKTEVTEYNIYFKMFFATLSLLILISIVTVVVTIRFLKLKLKGNQNGADSNAIMHESNFKPSERETDENYTELLLSASPKDSKELKQKNIDLEVTVHSNIVYANDFINVPSPTSPVDSKTLKSVYNVDEKCKETKCLMNMEPTSDRL